MRNDSTLANLVLDNIGDAGQIKRKVYQRRLPENPSKDYYYIIRETSPTESILVEYGFIDNKKDLLKLQNDLDNYAEGVVKAIAEYTNIPYVAPNSSGVYIVQKGDTLYSIAKKFNVDVNSLKVSNNLSSNIISVGQKLLIPGNNSSIYIVQRGDSLWSISRKFGISVNDLINANNLSNLTIYIGQQLFIPSSSQSREYIVVAGDTLWGIAQRFNVSVNDLMRLNNLQSSILSVGQKLLIP